ncbi:MAG TPA: hypothetical protein VMV49_17420 [Candidatus Deferrimicrobium sp.]|nr:hypothetical protein [Candidatus Deferrimicrobium sp.]
MPDKEEKEEKYFKNEEDSYLISYTKHLETKIRNLKAEKQLIEVEKIRLDRELRSIKVELERMRQPPLVTADVVKLLENGRVIVKSTTGPEFIVKYSNKIPKEKLLPGTRVALNQRTFSIVEKIADREDSAFSAYKAFFGLPYDPEIIEVHSWKEIALDMESSFFIRVNSLEDLKLVARIYRVPVIFKKGEEYLAIYYDSPLFLYKP